MLQQAGLLERVGEADYLGKPDPIGLADDQLELRRARVGLGTAFAIGHRPDHPVTAPVDAGGNAEVHKEQLHILDQPARGAGQPHGAVLLRLIHLDRAIRAE